MTLAGNPWIHVQGARVRAVPALVRLRGGNSMRVGLLIGLLAVLNGMDLMFTLFAYRIGMLDEMNPVAAAYLAAGLKPSFIAYKLLMVLAGSVMLWRVRKSAWSGPACWLLVTVYVGLGWLWYQWAAEIVQMYEMRISLSF